MRYKLRCDIRSRKRGRIVSAFHPMGPLRIPAYISIGSALRIRRSGKACRKYHHNFLLEKHRLLCRDQGRIQGYRHICYERRRFHCRNRIYRGMKEQGCWGCKGLGNLEIRGRFENLVAVESQDNLNQGN